MHHNDHACDYCSNNCLNGNKCCFSGSSFTAVKSFKSTSERKPLPLKSGSCLDILKPSKLPVEDKTVKDDTQSKPPVSAGESVC